MRNTFRVGDLVMLQHPTYYLEEDGCPGVIVGGFAPRHAVDMRTMRESMAWTYEVRRLKEADCLDGRSQTVLVRPHQIRKPAAGEDRVNRHASRDQEVPSC